MLATILPIPGITTAPIKNITPTRRQSAYRSPTYAHVWIGLAAIVAGLLILGAALPRLIAGLYLAPHESDLVALQRGGGGAIGRIGGAIADYQAAARWHDDGATMANLAWFRFALAQRLGFSTPSGRALLIASLEAGERGLATEPGQTYLWARRARALALLAASGSDGVDDDETLGSELDHALALSIALGPAEPALVGPRARLGIQRWLEIDEPLRAAIGEEARLAVQRKPRALESIVRDPLTRRLVEELLYSGDGASKGVLARPVRVP
jgi:hypothetical protein